MPRRPRSRVDRAKKLLPIFQRRFTQDELLVSRDIRERSGLQCDICLGIGRDVEIANHEAVRRLLNVELAEFVEFVAWCWEIEGQANLGVGDVVPVEGVGASDDVIVGVGSVDVERGDGLYAACRAGDAGGGRGGLGGA